MSTMCLVILIGLPAAGKTSFCTAVNQELSRNNDYKCHTVTYDCIASECAPNKYRKSRSYAFKVAEDIVKSLQNELRKHIILIDDNMYYRSMRYEYYKLARKYQCGFLQVYIQIQLDVALARNCIREQKVLEDVMQKMAQRFEPPGKNHWELNSLLLKSDFDLTQFLETLDKCMDQPIKTHTQTSSFIPTSDLQKLDLMLRKIVHKRVTADKTKAAACIAKKKSILQQIRTQDIEKMNNTELYVYLENLFE